MTNKIYEQCKTARNITFSHMRSSEKFMRRVKYLCRVSFGYLRNLQNVVNTNIYENQNVVIALQETYSLLLDITMLT